ncbi:MAG: HEXXH motif-containing putative peptide modification protein [Leptospiraceae bacterium]|nr:HEXXH motif-containing putative peptide modification protein [Leptospiraceae bacterium]
MNPNLYFFSSKRLANWKEEYLNHIYNENLKLLNQISFLASTKIKLEQMLNFYLSKQAIACLEFVSIHLSEYQYFSDMDDYLSSYSGNENELLDTILFNLESDFSEESTYSLQFIQYTKSRNLKWQSFPSKMATKSLSQALKIQSNLLPNKDSKYYKKYKHRLKSPSQTGKILDDTKYIQIKRTDESKYLQLIHAKNKLTELWPEGTEVFTVLTDRIHLVRSKNLVSFSHFTEQGITYMNLWGRDFLDTMDDLIHENSHHHLNLILKKFKILKTKSSDEVYYSPWRHELRSLYAILHSVFTFTCGALLFEVLIEREKDETAKTLKKFRDKIRFRFMEESYNLSFSLQDLQKAVLKNTFTNKGKLLILELQSINTRHLKKIDSLKPILKKASLRKINELQSSLAKKRKEFNLSF